MEDKDTKNKDSYFAIQLKENLDKLKTLNSKEIKAGDAKKDD